MKGLFTNIAVAHIQCCLMLHMPISLFPWPFFVFCPLQCSQYHEFKCGSLTRLTHSQWNHWWGQSTSSQPTIGFLSGNPHEQWRGNGEALVDELISKHRVNSLGIKCLRQNKANLGSLSAKKPAYDNSLMAATHRSRVGSPCDVHLYLHLTRSGGHSSVWKLHPGTRFHLAPFPHGYRL